MEKYLLSIIIPTYNNVLYIRDALISLMTQTDEQVEIIIINDGSTDGTKEEIEHVLSSVVTSSHLIFISQDNAGIAHARNVGLSIASGDFITFLDGDDILSSRFYATIKPFISKEPIDLIDFYYSRFSSLPPSEKKEQIKVKRIVNNNDMDEMKKIFLQSQWHVFTRVFAKHLISGHVFPEGRRYEDMAFTPYTYLRAKSIIRLNRVLYFYRSHSQSITRNLITSDIDDIEFILKDAIKYLQEQASEDEKNILLPLMLMNCFKEIQEMHKKIYGYYNYNSSIIKTLQQTGFFIPSKYIGIKNKIHISYPLIWKKFSQWRFFWQRYFNC